MPPKSLAQHYQSRTDDELLALAADADSLTEEAGPILSNELRHRNLVEHALEEAAPSDSQNYLSKAYFVTSAWLQSSFSSNVLDVEVPSAIQENKSSWFRRIASFALHTFTVYLLAFRVSRFLVGWWFAWIAPILHFTASVSASIWYLEHLELMIFVPAMAAGYVSFARFLPATFGRRVRDRRTDSADLWAWVLPTSILLYEILTYRPPSVLSSDSMSAIKYFFDIQKIVVTYANRNTSESVRAISQIMVTAPFYAGIAYSLGALAAKRNLFTKLFTFESSQEAPVEEV